MRELKHLAINVVIWVLTYYALFENVHGAYNVLVFMIWIFLVASLMLFTDRGQEMIIEKSLLRSRLTQPLNLTDVIIALALVWFDHWFVGLILILTVLITEAGWDEINKIIASRDEAMRDQA